MMNQKFISLLECQILRYLNGGRGVISVPIDLTGLQPIRERSQQLLDYSFAPKGGVPEEELLNDIQKKLWGTGTTPGIYSRFAGQGIRPVSVGENRLDIPPELNYSS